MNIVAFLEKKKVATSENEVRPRSILNILPLTGRKKKSHLSIAQQAISFEFVRKWELIPTFRWTPLFFGAFSAVCQCRESLMNTRS